MSKFTLEITLGNEAMQDMADVAELLARAAHSMFADATNGETFESTPAASLRDLNGNRVAAWRVEA